MTRLRLCILCGGQSPEHLISILSAKNVVAALDSKKYEISIIYITREGRWLLLKTLDNLAKEQFEHSEQVTPLLGEKEQLLGLGGKRHQMDVFFPVLHGKNGEDGTIQGLLTLMNIPFIGCDVLSSALCMDKVVTKTLLEAAQIKTAKWLSFYHYEKENIHFDQVIKTLDLPLFVKPASTGSSIGVSKVDNQAAFKKAIDTAFMYGRKVLIEAAVEGREIEVSVLGNDAPRVSLAGEIITRVGFYDYQAKYENKEAAQLEKPAKLPSVLLKDIQTIAERAYIKLGCSGMARVDFFVTEQHEVMVNEINTIPGFTAISMYPQLWEISGLTYTALLDELVDLAMTKHQST